MEAAEQDGYAYCSNCRAVTVHLPERVVTALPPEGGDDRSVVVFQGTCAQCHDDHLWVASWRGTGDELPSSVVERLDSDHGVVRNHFFVMSRANAVLTQGIGEQADLLQHLSGHIDPTHPQFELVPLLIGSHECLASLVTLADSGRSNAALILTRSLLERALNFKYLSRAPEEERKAFHQYLVARLADRADRRVELGSWKLSVRLEGWSLDAAPDTYREAVRRFTTRKGGLANQWTELSVERRLRAMLEWHPVPDIEAEVVTWMSLYRDASEAIHGSSYGVLVDKYLDNPANPRQLLHLINGSLSVSLLSALAISHSLVRFIEAGSVGERLKARGREAFRRTLDEHRQHVDLADRKRDRRPPSS